MYPPILNIAIKAAREAGNIIARAVDRLDVIKVSEKKPNDFVTEVDAAAERAIIATIQKAYPNHGILAEESGIVSGTESTTWIIDPLDGTHNFIQGLPQFAVSIAIQQNNKIEHAVIYDPMRQDLFVASRGRGAQLNNKRLRVNVRKDLTGTLIGTGFSHNQCAKNSLETIFAIMNHAGSIRWTGSAALSLAYVAAGYLDGFWSTGLMAWDIAAGVLLVKEAGGLVMDLEGNEDYLKSGNIVSGNAKICKALLQLVHSRKSSS